MFGVCCGLESEECLFLVPPRHERSSRFWLRGGRIGFVCFLFASVKTSAEKYMSIFVSQEDSLFKFRPAGSTMTSMDTSTM